MLPLQSYYGFESCSNRIGLVQEASSMKTMDGGDSSLSSGSKAERKSIAACKSHSEAERRRRQRINSHLSTLRTLLPNTTKTDKASLLGEVVRHVKELRKRASDVATQYGDGCSSGSEWLFPGEKDEVTVGYCDGEAAMLIKATLCCDDRPGLNRDLTQAIRSVRVRTVKAEMATVGGRTKSVVVMQRLGGGDEDLVTLRRALKGVMENRASGSGLAQVAFPVSKRARLYSSINDGGDDFLPRSV